MAQDEQIRIESYPCRGRLASVEKGGRRSGFASGNATLPASNASGVNIDRPAAV